VVPHFWAEKDKRQYDAIKAKLIDAIRKRHGKYGNTSISILSVASFPIGVSSTHSYQWPSRRCLVPSTTSNRPSWGFSPITGYHLSPGWIACHASPIMASAKKSDWNTSPWLSDIHSMVATRPGRDWRSNQRSRRAKSRIHRLASFSRGGSDSQTSLETAKVWHVTCKS